MLRTFDDRLKRVQQAEQIDFELGLEILARDVGETRVGPLPLRGPHLLAFVKQPGGRFVPLVLEQPPHQDVARILLVAVDAGSRLGPRQQHSGLDVNQRGRHHQEVAGDVEIQLLQQVNRIEILLRDEHDRDVVDVQLVLPDQVQEQIERAVEVVELDGKRIER